jgi:hypothetical protein
MAPKDAVLAAGRVVLGATPGSGVITVTFTLSSRVKWLAVYEVTDYDEATPLDFDFFFDSTGGSSSTLTLTHATPAADTTVIAGALDGSSNTGVTPDANFTEDGETQIVAGSLEFALQVQHDLAGADSTTGWSDLSAASADDVPGVAIGIAAADAGGVVTGAVSVAAVSDVVVGGLVLVLGDAVVAAVGTFASDGLVQVFGQATIAGAGLVVVEGDVATTLVEGSVLISASSSIVFADGLLIRHGEVQIGAQGEAAADGLVLVLGGALVAADGDVAVDGLAQVFGAVTLAGTGIVVIDGSVPSSSVETSASLSHALVTGTALSAALVTTTALDHNLITEAFPDGD